MSLTLTGSTESLQAVLAAAPATNQSAISTSYVDQGGNAAGTSINTNSTTAVTIVPASAGSVGRVVNSIVIRNADTAPITLTINKLISSTAYIQAKITLAVGYMLVMALDGWSVYDANGVFQSSGTGGGGGGTWGSITGTLSSQTDLQAALSALTPIGKLTVNAQTGTTYTPVLADIGKDVQCANASAIAVAIPLNATTAFAIGSWMLISQAGAGIVTVSGVTGVTVLSPNGAATVGNGDLRAIEKVATDTWRIV